MLDRADAQRRTIDEYDQTESPKQVVIKYDNSMPSVSIALEGTFVTPWYVSPVNGVITFSGGEREVQAVEYSVDNENWTAYVNPVQIAAEGENTLYARVISESGRVAQASRSFTIDMLPPQASIHEMPEMSPIRLFKVHWSGEDMVSGITDYDVYVSVDGAAFELWRGSTIETTAIYTGEVGSTYRFYCIARDNAGNEQPHPSEPQAHTTVYFPWNIPGDANMNCRVDAADLIFVRNLLLQSIYDDLNWMADVNHDGRIDLLDLVYVRNRLGDKCPE